MRIGPFRIARAAKAPPLDNVHDRAEGASGTINLNGYLVQDEYNPDLRGKQGQEIFTRMLRSDASVREAYLHCVSPVMTANWDVEPAGEEPDQLEQAAFARRALFEWQRDPFPQLLQSVLGYLPAGFQLYEMVEQVIEDQLEWLDPDSGETQTGDTRQFLVWRRWAQRKQDTIWRWIAHDGELEAVQQMVFKDGDYVWPEIQMENLALFTNEQEADDWTGQSIFRAAYFAWSLKQMVEKIAGISVERHGVGINVGYIPESSKGDEAMVGRVEEMLQQLAAGERPYLVFPGQKQQSSGASGGEGFLFEIVTPTGGLPDFVPLLQYLRGEIKGSVVARFSELGHGQAGARATGDVQSHIWYEALQAVADYVASVFNERLERLIDKNYVGVKRYPKLVARDIEARTLTEYADALSKLALAQLIVPDKSARGAARKAADIPEEDENLPITMPSPPPPGQPAQNGQPPTDQASRAKQAIEAE